MNKSEIEHRFESKRKIAVVTNGTATTGLEQSLKNYTEPVTDLFKSKTDLDFFNIKLDTRNLQEIKNNIVSLQQDYNAVVIAGVKAPGCYQLLSMVTKELTIPVIMELTGVAVATGAAIINVSKLIKKPLDEMRFLCLGCNELKKAVLQQLFLLGANPSLMVSCRKGGFDYAAYGSTFAEIVVVFDFKYEHIRLITMELPSNPVLIILNKNLNAYIPEIVKIRSDAVVIPYLSNQKDGIGAVSACHYLLRTALEKEVKRITPDMHKSASVSLADFVQLDHP